MSDKITILDVKSIPPAERHPNKILDVWNRLGAGETLQLLNDHDPKHLYAMFQKQFTDSFVWEYVQQGPIDWVVNIKKTK